MQIFISWSGLRSKAVGVAFRDWLPVVLQSIEPWFSAEDIDKGSRWLADLNQKLANLSAGLICVTPENQHSPWLVFEAGALSKSLDAARVCPIVIGMDPTDVKGPLSQFQATRPTKDDVRQLVATLNRATASPVQDNHLDTAYDALWPKLEVKLRQAENLSLASRSTHRQPADILVEVLDRIRGLERTIAEPRSTKKQRQEDQRLFSYLLECEQELRERLEIDYQDLLSLGIQSSSAKKAAAQDELRLRLESVRERRSQNLLDLDQIEALLREEADRKPTGARTK